MILTPTQVEVAESRCRENLFAAAAHARLVREATSTQPRHSATPRPVTRIRAGLRQAIASLAAVVSIG